MESVRKEQKIMQEKLLYLQVKSEPKAAKSGKKPWVRMGFKNGSKKAKKRELGENGENSGENKTPFPTYFSGTLKILLERTFTPFFCCWPKSAKRCKWWLQKNIATRFCSNTPNIITKDQMYRICHISKKTCLFLLESGLVPNIDSGKKTLPLQNQDGWCYSVFERQRWLPRAIQSSRRLLQRKRRR